jgi:hypothetical protein
MESLVLNDDACRPGRTPLSHFLWLDFYNFFVPKFDVPNQAHWLENLFLVFWHGAVH